MGFRAVVSLCVIGATIIYVYIYAKKVRSDRSKSILGNFTFEETPTAVEVEGTFNLRHGIIILLFFAGFFIYAYGSKELKWGIKELGAVMIPIGIICGIIGKTGKNSIAKSFVKGAQAMVVMPIMAPLAELIGVTKQVAVLAYQYGDGMSNIIIPTSGILTGCLGIAKISFTKWVKWVLPLFLTWLAIGAASIVVAVLIVLA